MKTYKPEARAWHQIWLQNMRGIVVIVLIAGLGVPFVASNFNPSFGRNLPVLLRNTFILLLVFAGLTGWVSWRTVRRLNAFEITLADDRLTYAMLNRPPVTILYEEITEILDSPSMGIIVKTNDPSMGIVVNTGLIDEDEFRERLSEIKPFSEPHNTSLYGKMAGTYSLLLFIALPFMFVPMWWLALPAIAYVGYLSGQGVWLSLQKTKRPLRHRMSGLTYRLVLFIAALVALAIKVIPLLA